MRDHSQPGREIIIGIGTYRPGVRSLVGTLAALVLPAILLPGCASTPQPVCDQWRARVETVRVCNAKGMQCTLEEQSVPYCSRTAGRRTVAAPASVRSEPAAPRKTEESRKPRAAEKAAAPARAPVPPEPAPKKIAKADPPPPPRKAEPPARTAKAGPDLDRFWRSLYSASRVSGLRYGPVREVIRDPATMPASSARVVAALRKHVNTVVSMEIASDRKSTPMDHRLSAVVYQAHSPDAAAALYDAIVRDEWRERKRIARRGVRAVVVNADDKRDQTAEQLIYVQRGSYVLDVHEWKSVHRDAKGKPIPGKRFAHTPPVNADTVAKAAIRTFPAK